MVERYLVALRQQLHGSSRARAAVIEEIHGGLDDAISATASHEVSARAAAEKAIIQLGTPREVAAAFAGELAIRQARKILWLLLLTGPLVGIWWFLLLAAPFRDIQPASVLAAIPALPVVAAAVALIVVILMTTGTLIRWLPESRPSLAVLAATIVGLVIVAVDSTMLAILATRILTGGAGTLSPTIAIIAAITSIVRLPFAAVAAWQGWRTQRLLGRPTQT
jgi:hypothetical protein